MKYKKRSLKFLVKLNKESANMLIFLFLLKKMCHIITKVKNKSYNIVEATNEFIILYSCSILFYVKDQYITPDKGLAEKRKRYNKHTSKLVLLLCVFLFLCLFYSKTHYVKFTRPLNIKGGLEWLNLERLDNVMRI